MYGIFTYICHKIKHNVAGNFGGILRKKIVHEVWVGVRQLQIRIPKIWLTIMANQPGGSAEIKRLIAGLIKGN